YQDELSGDVEARGPDAAGRCPFVALVATTAIRRRTANHQRREASRTTVTEKPPSSPREIGNAAASLRANGRAVSRPAHPSKEARPSLLESGLPSGDPAYTGSHDERVLRGTQERRPGREAQGTGKGERCASYCCS